MACRSMVRSAILIEPILRRPLNSNRYHIASSRNKCNKLTTTIRSCRFHSREDEDPPHPQDAVSKAANNEWLALDQKVNSYPNDRGFTAIGTGGEDFVQAMVIAVESVILQPIPQRYVKQKLSSGGKYVSVNIGPIQVVSSEQVQAVYNAMRKDDRVKYFL